jgi:hypothetical protein
MPGFEPPRRTGPRPRDARLTRVNRSDPRMGAYSAAGVVGGTGAVIALAFGGPLWAVVWIVPVLVIGATLHLWRSRRHTGTER